MKKIFLIFGVIILATAAFGSDHPPKSPVENNSPILAEANPRAVECALRFTQRSPGTVYTVVPGVDVALGQGQVFLRGQLSGDVAQGMSSALSVVDESDQYGIFRMVWPTLFFLTVGDEVFILNEKNQILERGFFGYKNGYRHPQLYKEPQLSNVSLESEKLGGYVQKNALVAVVHTFNGPVIYPKILEIEAKHFLRKQQTELPPQK